MDPIEAVLRNRGPVVPAPSGSLGVSYSDPVRARAPGTFNTDGLGLLVGLAAIPGVTPSGVFDDPALVWTGGVFWFQCPPLETMPVDQSWTWNDYVTVASGMHSNPEARNLAAITFSSLLVDTAEAFRRGQQEIPGPNYAVADSAGGVQWTVAWLKRLGDSMRPFQLQWGQPQLWGRWDGMMAATLRSFHVEERAGEVDARYFTVSFTEYPDAKLLKYAPPPAAPGKSGKRGPHTTTNGQRMLATLDSSRLPPGRQTLASLAKHYYGVASQWRLIQKASGLPNVTANQNLRTTVGTRKPPAKIQIPHLPSTPKTRRKTP